MKKLTELEVPTELLVNLLYAYVGSSAFTATLYTLFSRDPRLKPGAPGLLKVLLILCIGVVSEVLAVFINIFKDRFVATLFSITFICSLALFIIGWFGLFFVYYKAHIRIFHLRESIRLHHLRPFRWIRRLRRQEYEHEMEKRDVKGQLRSLSVKLSDAARKEIAKGYSFLLTGDDENRILDTVFELILDGLEKDETVNFVCINKHPIQVWERMKHNSRFSDMEEKIRNDFIIIDAYTPNYGFDDEINELRLRELERGGVKVVRGKTIPGIHSATASAFNLTKQKEKKKEREVRRPNRMVYDSISTLSHISSVEGIQVFFNHMIPAEKLYGMWTFIIEYSGCDIEIMKTVERLVDSIFEFDVENKDNPPNIKKLRIHSGERRSRIQGNRGL